MAILLGFLDVSLTDASGFPRLLCELDPSHLEDAAAALAEAVAARRIGFNPRLHDVWTSHHTGGSTVPVEENDLELLKAGLLQNIGTPAEPAPAEHLHGLIAESVVTSVTIVSGSALVDRRHLCKNDLHLRQSRD